jgi:nucleoside phosphorylase
MLKLAEIANAVKPRERTDKYLILAALYCLNALNDPVTTRQVTALLKGQFGKRAVPDNVTASLTKYSAYVDPADVGPPRKWQLTQQGLAHLRALSGLSLVAPSNPSDFQSDVGVVCALEDPEWNAVAKAFGGANAWEEILDARYPHVYRECKFPVNVGSPLRMIGVTTTSMGLTAAAIATTQLVLRFQPRLVMMIGIAAGTEGGKKQFGDVLVADPSVDYNSGKVVMIKSMRKFQPDPYPIGLVPRLRSVLKKYQGANHTVFQRIQSAWKNRLPGKPNRLHLGALGAADQVVDDATRVVEIEDHWRKLIGVEMESYAVYRACSEAPQPRPDFVAFKAVCDFAASKSDSWQEYAAYTAAEFAAEFLRSEWHALWTEVHGAG